MRALYAVQINAMCICYTCPPQATASASSATPTCDQPRWCACAMSATMARTLGDASSAVALACRMHTTARSVHSWRRMYGVDAQCSL